MKFGMKLRYLRKSRGMRQLDLAPLIGIERCSLSNYETGVSLPGIFRLQKIANALGISLDTLMEGVEE